MGFSLFVSRAHWVGTTDRLFAKLQGIKKPPGSLAVFLVSVAFSSSATLSIRQRCEKRIKPKIKAGGGHGVGLVKF
jgi:hypothetical protein